MTMTLGAFGNDQAIVKSAEERKAPIKCQDNLKQFGIAINTYHDAYLAFPPLYTVDANGKPLHSWRVLILPFLEEEKLYDQIRLNEPWDSPHNRQFHNKMPGIFQCSSNPGKGCCYSGIAGEGFVPAVKNDEWTGRGIRDITNGISNTLAIVEVRQPFNWMDPNVDVTLDELAKGINKGRVGSSHTGVCNVAALDGVARFVPETIATNNLRELGKIESSGRVPRWK
jgi:hypothetical protein